MGSFAASSINGNEQFRVFDAAGSNPKVITISDLTIADGLAFQGSAFSGSDSHVIFERVVMTNNSESDGNSSTLQMTNGTLEIIDSVVVNNGFGRAGILRVIDSQTTITNTTFSGNDARPINVFNRNSNADRLSLRNVTITDNGSRLIEIVADGGPTLFEYQNTILDSGGESLFRVRGNNLAGLTIVSKGHNLLNGSLDDSAAHDAGLGDLRDTDPHLAPLADNGGPTQTHALLPGSPAINAGDNALAVDPDGNALAFDQRGEGFDRIFDGFVDIGAFETTVPDTVAPAVESTVINDGDEQRSMVNSITVSFSEVVNVSASDFLLQHTTTNTNITPTVSTQVISGKTVATLTFNGDGIIGGSLADGNYSLTVLDTIADRVGNTLDGDGDGEAGGHAVDDFFRLFGDSDGDRDVDGQDYGRFGLTFLKTVDDPSYNVAFDFDNDGDVDGQDYGQFGLRFLQTLPG